MRVVSKVGKLPFKFGRTRPLGSRIIRYVRDGRTDGQTDKSNAYCPLPYGRGHNNTIISQFHSCDNIPIQTAFIETKYNTQYNFTSYILQIFYTWWNLSVIREVSTWIFSWSPLKYRVARVGQKVTKFGVFSDRTRKLSVLTPERGRIL